MHAHSYEASSASCNKSDADRSGRFQKDLLRVQAVCYGAYLQVVLEATYRLVLYPEQFHLLPSHQPLQHFLSAITTFFVDNNSTLAFFVPPRYVCLFCSSKSASRAAPVADNNRFSCLAAHVGSSPTAPLGTTRQTDPACRYPWWVALLRRLARGLPCRTSLCCCLQLTLC